MVYYAYELDDYSEESMWHHGVSGQKWGVRNGPPYPVQSGTTVRFAKSKMTESTLRAVKNKIKEERASKKQHVDSRYLKVNKILVTKMSDEDLKNRISRLKLENEYKKLLYENKHGKKGEESKKKDEGEKKAKSIIGTIGETAVTELIKGSSNYLNQRLASKTSTKIKIKEAKDAYKADRKLKEYENRAHYDSVRANTKDWLNSPFDKTEAGKEVMNWWLAD